MIKVTIWNEFYHEQHSEKVRAIYPKGIHGALAEFLETDEELQIRTATLYDPECGLTQEVLDDTDVLIWWGHMRHGMVPDEVAERVAHAVVKNGMGMVFLHSAHKSKPFMKLLGTSGDLSWREIGEKARVWVVKPTHPIAQGLPEYFEVPHEEMYGEPFDIPDPDELVFITWFQGGEVFRSGCCYTRGKGRIFYYQDGHESYPVYHQPEVQKVIHNAVKWVAPFRKYEDIECRHIKEPIEDIEISE